jgi:hypothetical protein
MASRFILLISTLQKRVLMISILDKGLCPEMRIFAELRRRFKLRGLNKKSK